ncbi:MAG: diphosphate--fructose-6-phosphate 1-phosphotransferase [Bauldia sp.]|uniref:diphosphate--fructose-6-phosphate 1-phosphotransferase n=1 Tax=Bauldia sp. TaxID=2575872 RepID=UPI001D3B8C29|nr:diphosphate--fructose-6-phosphate 1-phosphotransferase [Bauldia sp.]MCB1495974.1 diphosphate--fructose-6-phosphate 1-phosphotransferase [Bauldia sp.]
MSKVFVIAQGGGPTAVINQTVAGAALAARERYPGSRILGARHGVRGIDRDDYVDLSTISETELMRFANTPNSGLGSTRDKPDATYCQRVLAGLDKVGASAFIYIGGNDTSGTLDLLDKSAGDHIHFIHAPKTIDNDLVENDHTPGFMSAALFVANAFLSVDLDFRAMRGVYVGIVMGRHAGFLTASAAAWRRDETDGPHLVYVPEVPFTEGRLIDDIRATLDKHGRCVIAMSEGVQTADHKPLAESLIPAHLHERDAHGNLQLSGGDLGLALQEAIKDDLPGVRARVDTFGYLPRGFIGAISAIDQAEAFAIGRFAVESHEAGSGSVAQTYEDGRTVLRMVPLAAVANRTKTMPADFLTAEGNHLTETGLAYFRRLLPPRPDAWTPFV